MESIATLIKYLVKVLEVNIGTKIREVMVDYHVPPLMMEHGPGGSRVFVNGIFFGQTDFQL